MYAQLGYVWAATVAAAAAAGTCLSKNLRCFLSGAALNLRINDGTVWNYVLEDGPGLPKPDILGRFAGFLIAIIIRASHKCTPQTAPP